MGREFQGKDADFVEKQRKEQIRQEKRKRLLEFIGQKFYRDLNWHCEHYTSPKCPKTPALICLNSLEYFWPEPQCDLHNRKYFPILLDNEFVVAIDQGVLNENQIFEECKKRYDSRIEKLKKLFNG